MRATGMEGRRAYECSPDPIRNHPVSDTVYWLWHTKSSHPSPFISIYLLSTFGTRDAHTVTTGAEEGERLDRELNMAHLDRSG